MMHKEADEVEYAANYKADFTDGPNGLRDGEFVGHIQVQGAPLMFVPRTHFVTIASPEDESKPEGVQSDNCRHAFSFALDKKRFFLPLPRLQRTCS